MKRADVNLESRVFLDCQPRNQECWRRPLLWMQSERVPPSTTANWLTYLLSLGGQRGGKVHEGPFAVELELHQSYAPLQSGDLWVRILGWKEQRRP